MGVSKSGYYRWKGRQGKLNRYEQDRQLLTKLLTAQHKKHPSHGYHMLAKAVFEATGWVFSHNLAHKCCKQAGIRSKARKDTYKKAGEEHIAFPNEVQGNWNATHPVEIVVSDMTIFKSNGRNWEWTLLVDTFNNEILAHQQQRDPCSPSYANSRLHETVLPLPGAVEAACGQEKRGADTPSSLAHRPGFRLLLTSLPTGSRTL